MQAFEPSDLATGIKDLSQENDTLPAQRNLGLCWDINMDTFTFKLAINGKPYTRRDVLSVINSIFDPLGLAAPVTIKGRLLLRELANVVQDWDAPLPEDKMSTWETWRMSRAAKYQLPFQSSLTPNYVSFLMYPAGQLQQ